ncbi:MAG TPA: helix-turn-helix domain-containing protein [Alphaproteobacteria bacterium]|nr:helix-turn-helix domain-containing protein [Alphaproteobacteria bacterium]
MRNIEKLRATEARHAPVPLAECALVRAIGVVGDAWALLILREAVYGITRFEEMRADLGIPKTVLSDRLGRLVEAGLFRRVPYREAGQRTRHAYELTEKGRALMPALAALRGWAEAHLPGGKSPLALRHRGCGGDVRAVLACSRGHVVDDPGALEAVVERPLSPR